MGGGACYTIPWAQYFTLLDTPDLYPNCPLDFDVDFTCTYSPDTITISAINYSGGFPPYQSATSYFSSEVQALANTSWGPNCWETCGVGFGVPATSDDTYWLVVKDSIGNILAKSITTDCIPNPTPTPTNTQTQTNTPTNTQTPTNTPTNTSTPTQTETPTNTPTNTSTPTNTPTNTPTSTETPTQTPTPTNTETPTLTPTATNTQTPTNTETPTNTPTITSTPTSTPATLPTVTTDGYGSLFNGAAQITGTIVSNGGSTITERGIVWGTSPNPTIANNIVSDGSGNPDALGQFVHTYTMLPNPHGTPVYVRIYATNAVGTSYGNQVSFTMPCFIKGTKITLASGFKKNIEDISYEDSLLVWNFDEGRFDSANPLWIMSPVFTQYVNILFSDGSKLGISGHLNHDGGHRIFNLDKGEFTYVIPNEHSPIGTRTFNDKGNIVTIVGKEESTEVEEIYNVVTNRHLNIFAEGILTSRRLNNLYPIADMKFIKDERSITSIEEFKGVPIEYYEGLRLGEQPLATNSEGFLVKTPAELAYTLPTVSELAQWTVEFIKKKS
jgi:hypothetical protein